MRVAAPLCLALTLAACLSIDPLSSQPAELPESPPETSVDEGPQAEHDSEPEPEPSSDSGVNADGADADVSGPSPDVDVPGDTDLAETLADTTTDGIAETSEPEPEPEPEPSSDSGVIADGADADVSGPSPDVDVPVDSELAETVADATMDGVAEPAPEPGPETELPDAIPETIDEVEVEVGPTVAPWFFMDTWYLQVDTNGDEAGGWLMSMEAARGTLTLEGSEATFSDVETSAGYPSYPSTAFYAVTDKQIVLINGGYSRDGHTTADGRFFAARNDAYPLPGPDPGPGGFGLMVAGEVDVDAEPGDLTGPRRFISIDMSSTFEGAPVTRTSVADGQLVDFGGELADTVYLLPIETSATLSITLDGGLITGTMTWSATGQTVDVEGAVLLDGDVIALCATTVPATLFLVRQGVTADQALQGQWVSRGTWTENFHRHDILMSLDVGAGGAIDAVLDAETSFSGATLPVLVEPSSFWSGLADGAWLAHLDLTEPQGWYTPLRMNGQLAVSPDGSSQIAFATHIAGFFNNSTDPALVWDAKSAPFWTGLVILLRP